MTASPSFKLPAQRPEHLIRTVVSGNLRGEQQLDDGPVDVNVGTDGAQLVERGDDAVADRPVRLEETGDAAPARPPRSRSAAAPTAARGALRPGLPRPAARRRSPAPPYRPAARALRRLPPPAPARPSARIRTGAKSSRTRRCAARMACRATSTLSSAMSGGRRSSERRFLDRSDQTGRLGSIAPPLGPAAARHGLRP